MYDLISYYNKSRKRTGKINQKYRIISFHFLRDEGHSYTSYLYCKKFIILYYKKIRKINVNSHARLCLVAGFIGTLICYMLSIVSQN